MPTVASEGSLLLTGSFQTLFEGTTNNTFEGKVDLAALIATETVEIRGEEKIAAADPYRKYKQDETYVGVLDDPMIGFQPRSNKHGYKISIRQTSGTFRTVKFLFFKF